jgi:hypothetical protein
MNNSAKPKRELCPDPPKEAEGNEKQDCVTEHLGTSEQLDEEEGDNRDGDHRENRSGDE